MKNKILLAFTIVLIFVVVLENQTFLDDKHLLVGSMLYLLWFTNFSSRKKDNNNQSRLRPRDKRLNARYYRDRY